MTKEPVTLHDETPFHARLKQIHISDEDYEKEKADNNHRLIKDTRGRMFEVAWARGLYLHSKKGNEQYPIVARLREKNNGDFEILNIISEPAEPPKETMEEDTQKMAEGGKK